jgi:hypothetical protein
MIVLAVLDSGGYFHIIFLCHCEGDSPKQSPRNTGLLRWIFDPPRNDRWWLMIKDQCLHAQGDYASIHERRANINVIAFRQADLIDDQ